MDEDERSLELTNSYNQTRGGNRKEQWFLTEHGVYEGEEVRSIVSTLGGTQS